jgi:hypothetical protein
MANVLLTIGHRLGLNTLQQIGDSNGEIEI